MPCTLDEFFALFLADHAPHSVDAYQKSHIGDSELEVSSWRAEPDGSLVRTIHFRHPIPSNFGASSALAERTQRFRQFASYGLCLETTTHVKGIIVSDCFHVQDQWIVEPCGETNVTLTVRHEACFTKRTLMKRMISNMTRSEVNAWYKGYSKMLLASLKEKGQGEMEKAETAVIVKPQVSVGRFSSPAIMAIMWGCVMAGVALLLLEGALLHGRLLSIEAEFEILRDEHLKAFNQLLDAIDELKASRP